MQEALDRANATLRRMIEEKHDAEEQHVSRQQ